MRICICGECIFRGRDGVPVASRRPRRSVTFLFAYLLGRSFLPANSRLRPSDSGFCVKDMDISVIFKIAAVGIIITVVCQVLKKSDRDDIATLVSLVGLVIVLTVVIGMVGDLFEEIRRIFELY